MLTLQDLSVGQSFERAGPELTQARFIAFGQLHGTDAPIHTDPDYAARTPFGSTIAHGMMILAVFETWICDLFGSVAWDRGGTFQSKLLNVVKAGEPTTYRIEVKRRATETVTLTLTLHSGDRLLAIGEATLRIDQGTA